MKKLVMLILVLVMISGVANAINVRGRDVQVGSTMNINYVNVLVAENNNWVWYVDDGGSREFYMNGTWVEYSMDYLHKFKVPVASPDGEEVENIVNDIANNFGLKDNHEISFTKSR